MSPEAGYLSSSRLRIVALCSRSPRKTLPRLLGGGLVGPRLVASERKATIGLDALDTDVPRHRGRLTAFESGSIRCHLLVLFLVLEATGITARLTLSRQGCWF